GGGDVPPVSEPPPSRPGAPPRATRAKPRPEGEGEKGRGRAPIKIYRARLKQFGIADETVARIDAHVKQTIDDATAACKAAPPPPADILCTDVYADGGWAWRN